MRVEKREMDRKAKVKIGVVAAVIALAGMWAGVKIAQSAGGATFSQTDWSGGLDGGSYATASGWTKYSSKDANITAGTELTLSTVSGNFTDTSTADFNKGNFTNTTASSNMLYLEKVTTYIDERKSTIDGSSYNVGTWTSIYAVSGGSTPADAPHIFISYRDRSNSDLKVANSTDGGYSWTTRTVDTNADAYGTSVYALNTSNVFTSHYDGAANDLIVYKTTDGGGNWTEYTAESTGNVGQYSSLYAKDSSNIIVSHRRGGTGYKDLYYAKTTNGGVSWTPGLIEDTDDNGYFTSLAGNGNNVFVAYRKEGGSEDQLRFANSTDFGSSWSTKLIDNVGKPGGGTTSGGGISLYALDANSLYLAYFRGDTAYKDLMFIKSTNGGASWTDGQGVGDPASFTPIDTSGDVGRYCSIYAADANNIFISYYDKTYTNLKLASSTNGGGNWTTESLFVSGSEGKHTSIHGIDADNVFISDYYATAGSLNFWRHYKPYISSGRFYSQVFDSQTYLSEGTIDWTENKPATTTVNVYVRGSDNSTAVTDPSDASWTQVTNPGTSGNITSIISGYRYIQYYIYLAAANRIVSPVIEDVTLSYSGYPRSDGSSSGVDDNQQELISSWFNTADAANVISRVSWTETVSAGTTDVRVQLRTAPDNAGSPGTPTSWLGPTGGSDYYTNPNGTETINANHSDGSGDQWVQYKVWLYTQGTATPTLSDISVVSGDTTPPTVSSVSSTSADGSYKAGDTIPITVTFSETAVVSGTPQLLLNTGGAGTLVNYSNGTGTATLTFDYTVANGENSSDLDYMNTTSLTLNGGTIKDLSGNDATLTLFTPGAGGSLSYNKDIVIDTTAPSVINVSSTTANGCYNAGGSIDVTVTFDEAVTVDTTGGTPYITLETGTTDRNASYASGSGNTTLAFAYTVQSGDNSSDLDYVNTTSLNANNGTIQDAVGNDATLTLPSPGAANSLAANKAIVIDTTSPTLSSDLAASPAAFSPNGDSSQDTTNLTFTSDESGTYTITINEDVSALGLGNDWENFGSLGSGTGQFYLPLGVAVDTTNNKVYVADQNNNRIVRMDSGGGGTTLGANWESFGSYSSGSGQFFHPQGVAVDTVNNKVYVADYGNNRIVRMDSGAGGTTLGGNWQTFGSFGTGVNQFYYPHRVAVDTVNNKVYVADGNNNRIVRMDSGAGGTTLGANWESFGSYGSGSGQFYSPYDVAVDRSNNKVYVADVSNHRIARFDSGAGGTTLGANWESFGSYGSGTGQFYYPYGAAVDTVNNKIYVANSFNHRIARIDSGAGGTTLGANWESFGSYGSGSGQFTYPYGVAVDSSNNKVYVAEGNDRIDRFDSGSGKTKTFTGSMSAAAAATNTWDGTDNNSLAFVEGNHTASVTITDCAGNSSTGADLTITIDNVSPTAPSAAAIASGSGWSTDYISNTNKAAVKVSGSKSTDTVKIKIEIDDEDTFTNSKTTTLSGLGSGTTYADSTGIDASALADGNIAIRITAYDTAGNTSTQTVPTTAATFKKDTSAPSAPSAPDLDAADDTGSSSTDDITSQTTSLTFTGTAEANSTVTLSSDIDGALGSASADGAGAWTIDNVSLSEATHSITATATDAAGNESSASSALSVTVDTTSPSGYSVSIGQSYINNSNKTALSFTFASAETSASYNYSIDDTNALTSAVTGSGTISTATDTISSIDVSTLDDDTLTLTVYLTDPAGNQGANTTDTVTKDTSAPSSPSAPDLASADDTGSSNSDNITSQTTGLTFSGTAEAGSSVQLYVDGTAKDSPVTATGGSWTVDNVSLSAGSTYSITAKATDAAGNVSSASTALSVTVDTTNPSGTISAPSDNSYVTSTTPPSFTASASDSGGGVASVKFQYKLSTAGSYTDLNTDSSSPYAADWTGVTFTDGASYNLRIVTTDSAGNEATSGAITVTCDTTEPSGAISTPADGGYVTTATPTFSASASDATSDVASVKFQYKLSSSSTYSDLNTDTSSPYAADWGSASLSSGSTYNLRVVTTDNAGNSAASSSITITCDTTAPTVSSVSSSTANGSYNADDTIAVTVTFQEAVTVDTSGGTPYITLETGTTNRNASYASGSGSTILTFNYTVQAGDTSSDLDYAAATSLSANSGTIQDAAGNDADLTLPTPGAANSLGANKAIVIDTTAPTVSSVAASPASGTKKIGDSITVTITASESGLSGLSGTVNGKSLTLTDNGDNTYSTTYTIVSGDTDRAANSLPIAFTLQDAAGNSVEVSSFTSDTPVIDANPPVVTILSVSPSSGSVRVDDKITLTITADAAGYSADTITVNGVAVSGFADAGGGSYTATYTVAEGDTDVTTAGAITASAVLKDDAGNTNTPCTNVDTNALIVDANSPTVALAAADPFTGTLKVGDKLTITVTASESGLSGLSGTVNGRTITLVDNGGGGYVGTYIIREGDNDVKIPSGLIIDFTLKDDAGNEVAVDTFSTPTPMIDANSPSISKVIADPDQGKLKVGDTIKISINGGESGLGGLSGNVNGQIVTLSEGSKNIYEGTYTVTEDDSDVKKDSLPILFTLEDEAGNSASITSFTSSTPAIDGHSPTVSEVAAEPSKGTLKVDDRLTVTITASESGLLGLTGTINEERTLTLTDNQDNTYTGTYIIAEGDRNRAANTLPISITLKDEAGNAAYIEGPISPSPAIDAESPTAFSVRASPSQGILKVGDTLTVTITAGKPGLLGLRGKINDKDVTLVDNQDNTYTGIYRVEEGDDNRDSEANKVPISFTLNDEAGNASTVAAFTSSTPAIDANSPELTSVNIASNNEDSSNIAKVGDIVTLTFSANEAIKPPEVVFKCAGLDIIDVVTYAHPEDNTWRAQYTADELDIDGEITFTIKFSDLAGNEGASVTSATDGSEVIFNKSEPQAAVNIEKGYYVEFDWDSAATIQGTFADSQGLTDKVTAVKVSIMREDGEEDHYWNGENWQATEEIWNEALWDKDSGTWTYPLDNSNLTAARTYVVKAEVEDELANTAYSEADSFVYIPILRVERIVEGAWGDIEQMERDIAAGSVVIDGKPASSIEEVFGSSIGDIVAGNPVELIITASDYLGNGVSSYKGNKKLIFSGPAAAPRGALPMLRDVNGEEAEIGSPVIINFVREAAESGVSSNEVLQAREAETAGSIEVIPAEGRVALTPYKAEELLLNVEDADEPSLNSYNNANYGLELNLAVLPAPYDYFKLTGAERMTAGESNELTITAYDAYGNVAVSYEGSKQLKFSGLEASQEGEMPKVGGKDILEYVSLDFSEGVAHTTLVAYSPQEASLDVEDTHVKSSFDDEDYDLDLVVVPQEEGRPVELARGAQEGETGAGDKTSAGAPTHIIKTQVAPSKKKKEEGGFFIPSSFKPKKFKTKKFRIKEYGGEYAEEEKTAAEKAAGEKAEEAGGEEEKAAAEEKAAEEEASEEAVEEEISKVLAIKQEPPSRLEAGEVFNPVRVVIKDKRGRIAEDDNTTRVRVKAYALDGELNGTLTGRREVTARAGVAVFSDLSYNRAERIYLKFSAANAASVKSHKINIKAGRAAYFAIEGDNSMTAGDKNRLTITAYDKEGNVALTYKGKVSLTFSGLNGPSAAPSDGDYVSEHRPVIGGVEFVDNSATVEDVYFQRGVASLDFIGYKQESFTLNVQGPGQSKEGSKDEEIITSAYQGKSIDITINADKPDYFKVSGPSSVAAGGEIELTVTAYDRYGNKASGYSQENVPLVFSGPAEAPDGSSPLINGKELSLPIYVDFAEGVSQEGAVTLTAYKAEPVKVNVKAEDFSLSSDVDDSFALELTVGLSSLDHLSLRASRLSEEGKRIFDVDAIKMSVADKGNVDGDSKLGLSVQVSAYDKYGNLYTDYDSATAELVFSGPSAAESNIPTIGGVEVGRKISVAVREGVYKALKFVPYKQEKVSLEAYDCSSVDTLKDLARDCPLNSLGDENYGLDLIIDGN